MIGSAALLALALAAPAADEFEAPPTFEAARVLPAALASGEHFRVEDPVTSDGLVQSFRISSDFGPFEAYGLNQLAIRVQEIAAIAELREQNRALVVGGGLKDSVVGTADAVTRAVEQPKETGKGVGDGLKRLGKRIGRAARSGAEKAKEAVRKDDEPAEGEQRRSTAEKVKEGTPAAVRFVFGVNSAMRRWAEKLAIDPYTTNPTLRADLQSVAGYDAAGHFATRFVVPSLPLVGEVATVSNLVWGRDPSAIQELNEKRVAWMGLTPEDARLFFDNPSFTITTRTALVGALNDLPKAAGRDAFLREAARVTSEDDARFLARSAEELAIVDRNERPVTRVIADEELVLASLEGGRVVVVGPIDHLAWTRENAGIVEALQKRAEQEFGRRDLELRLPGQVSARARAALLSRGVAVREAAFPSPTAAVGF
jgi:hypothetical protein